MANYQLSMKGNIILFFISFGLVCSVPINNGNLASSTTDFACNINRRVELNPNDNVFTSAISAFNVLMLIYAGANGNTASQMKSAMVIPTLDNKAIYDQLRQLNVKMNKENSDYTLNTANRAYIQTKLTIVPEYKELIKTFTGSLEMVDFSKNVETVKVINDWVNQQTHGKIQTILSEVQPNYRLILVNAIYFKAKWKFTFNKADTKKDSFTTSAGNIIQTDMMKMVNPASKFNYTQSKELECEILELPYNGQEISMYIFLPFINSSVASLENKLNAVKINQVLSSKSLKMMAEIKMPKMHMEKRYELSNVLKSLGMIDLFSDKADLNGIVKNGSLKVSNILQKTYLEVNEEGTEAAGVTAGIITTLAMPITPPEPKIKFIANRPFVFIIHDNTNAFDYFMGRYVSP